MLVNFFLTFLKGFIIDINISTYIGLVKVITALKNIILSIVFRGEVLAEV